MLHRPVEVTTQTGHSDSLTTERRVRTRQLNRPPAGGRNCVRITRLLKSGSRLQWLFGETLVVVLGVLIALSLDDYWTDRQERDLELQYLDRIIADVHADIDYVDGTIRDLWVRKLRVLDAIAPVVRGKEPVPEDAESFLRNVALGGMGGASSTRWVTSTTFDDLRSTGNLRLIRDAELRRKIANYYYEFDALYSRARDRKSGYVTYVHSLLPAELREDMSFSAMQEFGTDRALEHFTSTEFQNLLNQEYNYAFFVQRTDFSSAGKRLAKELENYVRQLDGGT